MRSLRNSKWMPVLMGVTILAIACFQVYWLTKAYEQEQRTLEMRTNFLFRETVRAVQATKLKLDSLSPDSSGSTHLFIKRELQRGSQPKRLPRGKVIGMADVLMQRTGEVPGPRVFLRQHDSLHFSDDKVSPRQSRIMQFLFDVDALQDSIRVAEIEKEYAKRLSEQSLDVPFSVSRIPTVEEEGDRRRFNEITLGFAHPITYQLSLGNTFPLLLKRIGAAILFSLFLVGLTTVSFLLLYRNLLRQRRLSDIKNEFISNITHELKTPIATVSVAIEALRSFGGSVSPQKTKEYLDISASELQRLSLLVDKVLKLSMFEKREIDLKYEPLDMLQLVNEVASSMRLQFEKKDAEVTVQSEGDTCIEGDCLHLTSVLFNLFDNALKYSKGSSKIAVTVNGIGERLQLIVTDNGIGIAPEYHRRIFEKFFRVPHGNVHDQKGYGLGLSYVAHVVERHGGNIEVSSAEGEGSRFVITLPKRNV